MQLLWLAIVFPVFYFQLDAFPQPRGKVSNIKDAGAADGPIAELQELENRIFGSQDNKTEKFGDGELKRPGMDITNGGAIGTNEDSLLEAAARRIAEIQTQSASLQQEILSLQGELAAKLSDVAEIELSLVVKEPTALKMQQGTLPLAIQELSVDIGDVPLVTQYRPTRVRKDEVIPIYFGPLPVGKFVVRVRAQIGVLPAPWPAALPQGRWLVDDKLTLDFVPQSSNRGRLDPIKYVIELNPSAVGRLPRVTLSSGAVASADSAGTGAGTGGGAVSPSAGVPLLNKEREE